MTRLSATCLVALLCAGPLGAQEADRPLSAIDWLSDSVEQPVAAPQPAQPRNGSQGTRVPSPDEPPVAEDATVPDVSVRPLDAPSPDPIGLLPPDVTGFPRTIWSGSDEDILVALLRAERIDTLPAIQRLLTTLLLAEADPPAGAGSEGALFLARVDRLLDMGALDPAQALLEAADPDTPELFRRWFDVSLLTGTEADACTVMQDRPAVAPTASARVFCLARSGDWSAAALTLNTARVLGDIDLETADLMARFLDPDLFEGEAPLAPPSRPSPLVFRMREAIGEGMVTSSLPRAFAHADLRSTTGWKSQIEAAERLARTGAVQPNTLHDIYTARVPAASGGVWERVSAMQALERAIDSGDSAGIGNALTDAWEEMAPVGLRPVLAAIFGPALGTTELTGDPATLRFRLMMLTDQYETAALDLQAGPRDALLAAVARGQVGADLSVPARAVPIRDAFAAPAPDEALVAMAAEGRLGEAILRNIAGFEQGLEGDYGALAEALATFRALGLEDVARRAALEYLILERS